jgi:heme-degrading monooxygenase HmoA
MIKRLVKMTFKENSCEQFESIFYHYREKIASAHGCQHLELWRDVDHPNIYFTYSIWEGTDDLEQYRHSETFKVVWPLTKALFEAPAVVHTVHEKELK